MPDLDDDCGMACVVCPRPVTWRELATCADGKVRHLACMPATDPPRTPFAEIPEGPGLPPVQRRLI